MTKRLRAGYVQRAVDLSSLAHNLRLARRLLGPRVKFMLAVKKNAYGHGAIDVSRVAVREGVDWLGVFTATEGLELRKAGIRLPILVFSVTPREQLAAAIRGGLTLTITNADNARSVDHACQDVGKRASVHLKLDTGMGRLGYDPVAVLRRELSKIRACRRLDLAGVYSHLASADSDPDYSRSQLARLLDFVRRAPCEFGLVHLGASSTLDKPEFHLDMVRVGIAAYGGHDTLKGFRPAMRVTAPLLQVKTVPARSKISYGGTFRTKRHSTIALVGAGYGDGYLRSLSNRGWVWLRGHDAPVVGRVCMDQIIVDVTRVPGVRVGDRAELIGPHVSPAKLAEAAGTISYELFCSLGNCGVYPMNERAQRGR